MCNPEVTFENWPAYSCHSCRTSQQKRNFDKAHRGVLRRGRVCLRLVFWWEATGSDDRKFERRGQIREEKEDSEVWCFESAGRGARDGLPAVVDPHPPTLRRPSESSSNPGPALPSASVLCFPALPAVQLPTALNFSNLVASHRFRPFRTTLDEIPFSGLSG